MKSISVSPEMFWSVAIPSAGWIHCPLDYCVIITVSPLLSVTFSHAAAFLLHSTTSCFSLVSFYHVTSSYTCPLLPIAFAFLPSLCVQISATLIAQ